MRDARIAFDESLLVETRLEPRSGTIAAWQLLQLPQLPTAIRAFHDLVALEMIEVFQQCGLRVPEDVSVIGFVGLNAGFKTIPHITTVAHSRFSASASASWKSSISRSKDATQRRNKKWCPWNLFCVVQPSHFAKAPLFSMGAKRTLSQYHTPFTGDRSRRFSAKA